MVEDKKNTRRIIDRVRKSNNILHTVYYTLGEDGVSNTTILLNKKHQKTGINMYENVIPLCDSDFNLDSQGGELGFAKFITDTYPRDIKNVGFDILMEYLIISDIKGNYSDSFASYENEKIEGLGESITTISESFFSVRCSFGEYENFKRIRFEYDNDGTKPWSNGTKFARRISFLKK